MVTVMHKGFGGVAAMSFPGCVASLVGALQGSQTPSGRDGLWIATFVFFAIGVIGAIGWWLTREDDDKLPMVPIAVRGDRGGTAQQAGRDAIHINTLNVAPPTAVRGRATDHLKQMVEAMEHTDLRREIDELTTLATEGMQLAEHPGNQAMMWVFDGSERERRNEELRQQANEAEVDWTKRVDDKISKAERQYLADWHAATTRDARLTVIREIIKDLRARLR